MVENVSLKDFIVVASLVDVVFEGQGEREQQDTYSQHQTWLKLGMNMGMLRCFLGWFLVNLPQPIVPPNDTSAGDRRSDLLNYISI